MEKRTVSPQENLVHTREMLAKLTASGADPRVIGLWKAKVAQAEKLAEEAGGITGVGQLTVAVPAVGVPAAVGSTPVFKMTKVSSIGSSAVDLMPVRRATSKAAPCHCGCGGIAPTGKFLQGHDSKFASMIRKLDKGAVKLEQLPDMVQKMVAEDSDFVKKAREHNK